MATAAFPDQEETRRRVRRAAYACISRFGIAKTTVDDVAKEFGVRPKQIIADLKVLWFCGLPGAQMGDLIEIDIEAAEGDGVIHINNADYLARPLRLAADEATRSEWPRRCLRSRRRHGDGGLSARQDISTCCRASI